MAAIYSVPQNFSTTMNVPGNIDSSQTSGIILTSVTGLPTDGGILCFDWAATLDTSVAEYIEYTGISGTTLTGVIRGAEGVSAKAHTNGCTVVGVISQAHIKRLKERLDGTDTTGIAPAKIIDTSGNNQITFAKTSSAVNAVTITNAATGNAPSIAATGNDSNIDLTLLGKGTGKVRRDASYGTITTDSDGATITFNMATTNLHTVVLGGARTLAVSNVAVGQVFLIRLVQDGTGSRTVTWFTTIKWAGGSAPTLTTTINKADVLGFLCTSAGNYDGFVIGANV